MNTNRSKNSRNNKQNQYANNSMVNMSKAASAKKSSINTINTSDLHQLDSQRKNGSGQVRKSLDSEKNMNNLNVKSSHQMVRPKSSVFEIEDYKNLIRNSSQAQTSRNVEPSFKTSNNNIDKFTSEPVICTNSGAVQPTRNQNNKISKSSNEINESMNKGQKNNRQLIRQPSVGKVD